MEMCGTSKHWRQRIEVDKTRDDDDEDNDDDMSCAMLSANPHTRFHPVHTPVVDVHVTTKTTSNKPVQSWHIGKYTPGSKGCMVFSDLI